MQLFSNLPLDDDEQDFIDDPAKTARQAQKIFQKQDKYGQDVFNETMLTNFEGELEEMDNMMMNDAEQKQMMALFWSYLREDTYSAMQERRSGVES